MERNDDEASSRADRTLTPEAQRALAEAHERHEMSKVANSGKAISVEVGGRRGPDPVRYGDWEKNGIAWDF